MHEPAPRGEAWVVTTRVISDFSQDGYEERIEGTWDYTCTTDGLSLYLLDYMAYTSTDGTLFHRFYYEPPVLLVPADLHDGSAWTVTAEQTYGDPTGASTTQNVHWSYAASATTLDTPAGSFEALDVTITNENTTSHTYYSSEEGTVGNDDLRLSSYSPQ